LQVVAVKRMSNFGVDKGVSSVAVCCSVLQCAAVCCSVLQCVAVCCSARNELFRARQRLIHCCSVQSGPESP